MINASLFDALKILIEFFTGIFDAIASGISFINTSMTTMAVVIPLLPVFIAGAVSAGIGILFLRFLLMR